MKSFTVFVQLFILFFTSGVLLKAQNTSATIDLNMPHFELIENLFAKKLNALRTEKQSSALPKDKILSAAALDQAEYMLANNTLTHAQKTKDKETPQKRVFYYKGIHDQIGENCLFIYIKKPYKTKYNKTVLTVNTYEEAAEAIFQAWKNSAPHYENMINYNYDVQGLGFAFNKDSSKLYVAQVFSAKPYQVPAGLNITTDDYNIKPYFEKICSCLKNDLGIKALSKTFLVTEGDSVFIRSENLSDLKKLFNAPTDGVYIDLVLREQFPCEKNNLLHGATNYDGLLLKPVLFSSLFKLNRAKDGKNLYVPLGKVPDYYRLHQYNINYGFIKNGYACSYYWPHTAPQRNLDMLELYPKWIYEEGAKIKVDTFDGELTFNIPFERGKTNLSASQKNTLRERIKIYDPYIKNISIKTFSSVEGNAAFNLTLQEKRAREIQLLLETITSHNPELSIESKENWDDFFKQTKNTPFEYLNKLSNDKIKALLKEKQLLDSLDFLLKKTRTAHLNIKIKAIISDSSSAWLVLAAYQKAIQSGDSLQAFACQKKMLQSAFNHQFQKSDITQIELPYLKKFLPIWTNYVAMAVSDTEMIYSYKAREIALNAIKIDSSFKPLQFNFCIMALKYIQQYYDTLIPVSQLENKMMNCFKMGKTKIDSILVYHMLLNYSILSVFRHWERYEYDKLDKHLLNIKKYYPSAQITEPEAIKLSLLFNLYGRYNWTLELLHPYLKRNTKNEDLTFIYIQTYGDGNSGENEDTEWIEYLKRAKRMNEKRFYNWIDKENFQYLRIPQIKKEFCSMKPL